MTTLVSSLAVANATPADPAMPCPDYPVYEGSDLGARPDADGTTFRVWAPTASGVTLRLFAAGSDAEGAAAPTETHELAPDTDGTWLVRCDGVGHGAYYDYIVRFPDDSTHRTADPWARAAGVNGRRSMVVDLARTDPDGWADDRRPRVAARDLVIWETHIGDFSADPHSGVPAEHRGTYLAFTHDETHVDGGTDETAFPTCVAYLKRLGVTAVQLMPFYDYGSIDESLDRDDPKRGFNWGYDPLNYNVPEGSYSTDPFHGEVRITECKRMIQALHRAGIKVIMDVVYNHLYSTDNWFERMIPGYALRRNADGTFSDGSGCSNDVASEHPMMRRYIVDSVVYWASEYHIDGFRFDLMGLIDVDTMNAVRAALDALPDGASILMHGEPWSARQTALAPGAGVVLGDKRGLPYLDPRIGMFCDSTRDAVRGHVFFQKEPGYMTGAPEDYADDIRAAVDAWRGTSRETANVGQLIQYVSAHDDLTLWDKLCAAMRRMPSETDYAAGTARASDSGTDGPDVGRPAGAPVTDFGPCADLMRANRLAAGIVFASAGVPFLLGGEEFARTKHGVSDSFKSPVALNRLDWRRARALSGLVDHYRTLIALRRGNPAYYGGARMVIPRDDAAVVFRVGDDCIVINPTGVVLAQPTVDLEKPGPYDEVSKIAPDEWECVYASIGADGRGDGETRYADGPGPLMGRRLPVPPYSFAVWRRRGR